MARMTGFVFQDEYLERLRRLTDEEVGRLVRALAGYHITGEAPALDGVEGLAFDFIRQDVDRIEAQYRAKCETNRRNRRCADEGAARGDENGRPSTTVRKDKEKVKVKASREDDHHAGAADGAEGNGDALLRKAHAALSGLTDTHEAALQDYRQQLGDELISYAIDRTVANGAKGWGYTEAILQDYLRKGIRTVQEAQAADSRHKAAKSGGPQPRLLRAQQYGQREYREEVMQTILGVDDLFQERPCAGD